MWVGGMGYYHRAQQELERAVELGCRDADLLHNLGLVFYLKGQYSDAISKVEEVLNDDPSFAEAYYSLGTLYAKMASEKTDAELTRRTEWFRKSRLCCKEFLDRWRSNPKRRRKVEARIEQLEELLDLR